MHKKEGKIALPCPHQNLNGGGGRQLSSHCINRISDPHPCQSQSFVALTLDQIYISEMTLNIFWGKGIEIGDEEHSAENQHH